MGRKILKTKGGAGKETWAGGSSSTAACRDSREMGNIRYDEEWNGEWLVGFRVYKQQCDESMSHCCRCFPRRYNEAVWMKDGTSKTKTPLRQKCWDQFVTSA